MTLAELIRAAQQTVQGQGIGGISTTYTTDFPVPTLKVFVGE